MKRPSKWSELKNESSFSIVQWPSFQRKNELNSKMKTTPTLRRMFLWLISLRSHGTEMHLFTPNQPYGRARAKVLQNQNVLPNPNQYYHLCTKQKQPHQLFTSKWALISFHAEQTYKVDPRDILYKDEIYHPKSWFSFQAFPCISTGVYGYPNTKACAVALKTVHEFLKKNPDQVWTRGGDKLRPEWKRGRSATICCQNLWQISGRHKIAKYVKFQNVAFKAAQNLTYIFNLLCFREF